MIWRTTQPSAEEVASEVAAGCPRSHVHRVCPPPGRRLVGRLRLRGARVPIGHRLRRATASQVAASGLHPRWSATCRADGSWAGAPTGLPRAPRDVRAGIGLGTGQAVCHDVGNRSFGLGQALAQSWLVSAPAIAQSGSRRGAASPNSLRRAGRGAGRAECVWSVSPPRTPSRNPHVRQAGGRSSACICTERSLTCTVQGRLHETSDSNGWERPR